ncbi:ABC transporter permease [Sporosarcina sp.]|uniref:ABC transporter permease n=1 Tax=Sporosarcina sp. TaxID=49982 RepID=UPI002617BF2F|nr:ABC transporter permease [Sporosarcina sp.]
MAVKGSLRLSRFILRQDRMRFLWWLLGITVMTLLVPVSFAELYPTQQGRDVMAETMRNPAMTALVGPGNLDDYTLGAMVSHQMLLFTGVAVAVMNILLMVRHTRAEEEEGQTELLRALPVDRGSQLMAAMMVLFGMNVLLAVLVSTGLSSLSLESMDVWGSIWYGTALGAVGLFFAGVTAVCAQLSESGRGAAGLSFAVMIAAYLLQAMGLAWFTPFGWLTSVQPYSDNDGWAVLLLVIGSLLLAGTAFILHDKRDLGSGFLPSRKGRAHASVFLQNPFGLAWRLQRTVFISWAVGMLVLGLSYGSILGDLESFFEGNELLSNMLISDSDSSLAAQFLPMLMAVLAFISTIPALLAMHKLAAEERKSRLDLLLGRAVSRIKLMASFAVLAAVNAFVMLTLAAVGLWGGSAAVMEKPFTFDTVITASLVHFPAVAVMIAISVCLIGISQKATGFVWIYLLYSFITLYLGGLFQLPDWMEKLSPFGYVSKLPIEEMNWLASGGLFVTAAVLLLLGLHQYRKRDVEG